MSSLRRSDQSGEVVEKVLRRAEVARMARVLQNRLALANFKARHGWENLTLDSIEPKVEQELKRKRRNSSGETISDASSTVSERAHPSGVLSSSPMGPPLFSDDIHRSGSSVAGHRKQPTHHTFTKATSAIPSARKRARAMPSSGSNLQATRPTSWKSTYQLPESSPAHHRHQPRFSVSNKARASFVPATSPIPADASQSMLGTITDDEDDDQDLALHSFQVHSSHINSSPPRTPPPSRGARLNRLRNGDMDQALVRNGETGEEGADLLLYLATSPSPANPAMKARLYPPSTPPSRNPALPSSMMTTPGGGGFLTNFGAPMTPSQAFNFADFINVTPSPAQGLWGSRTPATVKTPAATKEARRKLNFDALVPPSGESPRVNRANKDTLGMELGGELVSPQ